MSLMGLLAWLCLLVSAFAHLSTFFEGGATLSWASHIVMGGLALVLWISACRQWKVEGTSFKAAFPPSSLAIALAVVLYASLTAHHVLESDAPSQTEISQLLSARAW